MPSSTLATKTSTFPVERTTLPNGLRVVVSPDRTSPVVAVAVYYDVGIRSEPEGRTGFAHLFEHLMFQGSASLGKMEHVSYVQKSGGTLNGSTRLDYTNYYEALPSHALERALFLEADRMRAPRITEENLANQIAVVKEEIRVNVLNQPYGGFPWLTLPPVLFETFPNAHNGYGSFEDLETATVADAEDFFARYYAPGNAVLAVGGDLDADEALRLAELHFGDIAAREVPAMPDFGEPEPTEERRAEQVDELATAPAVALGWRAPDPADLATYLPCVVLTSVLSSGDASRLRRRLVQEERLVSEVSAYIGVMQDPFDVRDPTVFAIEAHHANEIPTDQVVRVVDEELARIADEGLTGNELARVQARLRSRLVQGFDHVLNRTLSMAVFEQQRSRAELVMELPGLVAAVQPAQVQAAAARLGTDNRARLDLLAGVR